MLTYLHQEPGQDAVGEALNLSILSAVNAAEVLTKLIQRGEPVAEAVQSLLVLPCQIVSVDVELGLSAGRIHAATRKRGVSLGDAVCLALALREDLPALTADRTWAPLDIGVEVRLIR